MSYATGTVGAECRGSDIFKGGEVMGIEAKAAVALTVVVLLSGCARVARADDSLTIPPAAPTTLSGDPCGTSQEDQDVECRATASDRPITPASIENADAELPRKEQPSARGDGAAGGALKGASTVMAGIARSGPVGVFLCKIGGPYCAALVFVGASIGAASARP